jgi:hypothetical protein
MIFLLLLLAYVEATTVKRLYLPSPNATYAPYGVGSHKLSSLKLNAPNNVSTMIKQGCGTLKGIYSQTNGGFVGCYDGVCPASGCSNYQPFLNNTIFDTRGTQYFAPETGFDFTISLCCCVVCPTSQPCPALIWYV